jgi:hypothetical protein
MNAGMKSLGLDQLLRAESVECGGRRSPQLGELGQARSSDSQVHARPNESVHSLPVKDQCMHTSTLWHPFHLSVIL